MFCVVDGIDNFNSVNVKAAPDEIDRIKLAYSSVQTAEP